MTNIGLLGNPSTWAFNTPSLIPPEYKLPRPPTGFRIVRRILRRQVDTTVPININNSEIRWKIPSSSVITLDFRRTAVYVTVGVAVDPPHSARLSNFAWNMFSRFRLEQHGQYIEDRQYFGMQETFNFWCKALPNQFTTVAEGLYGYGSPVSRNLKSASWEYALPLPTDVLAKTVFPWFQLLQQNGVYISSTLPDVICVWQVAPPAEWIEVYGAPGPATGLTYTITKMEVEYEEITVESGNTEAFLRYWHDDPEPIPRIFWETWLTNIYPLTTGIEQHINIDVRVKSVQYIAVTVRQTNQTGDPFIYDKFETWIGPDSGIFPLLEYQWELNNNHWPDRPISLADPGNVQTYKKFLELFGNFYSRGVHMDVTAIGPVEHSTDKFVMAFDANQYPFSGKIIGPVSTERSSKYVILRLKFTAPPAANLELVCHTNYWRRWKFAAPSGQIVDW